MVKMLVLADSYWTVLMVDENFTYQTRNKRAMFSATYMYVDRNV